VKRTPLKRNTPLKSGKVKNSSGRSGPKIEKAKIKKAPVPSVAVLDSLFSRYIRRHGECQLWGYGGVTCSTQLQCSHVFSRRFYSVRWDKDNAICACAAHHWWQHQNPVGSTIALQELLGPEHLDALIAKQAAGRKPTPDQKREIAAWLRAELREAA